MNPYVIGDYLRIRCAEEAGAVVENRNGAVVKTVSHGKRRQTPQMASTVEFS
jgi:hypothetical protein